ncbi:MAG: anthranilate synthase component I family protein [Flavisolibacter sp.]
MLNWASRFNIFCLLDNQDYSIHPHRHDCLLAAGVQDSISSNQLNLLDRFLSNNHWKFGHLNYEFNHKLYQLNTNKENLIGFPELFFFIPEVVLQVRGNELMISGSDPQKVFKEISQSTDRPFRKKELVNLQQKLRREDYLEKINKLQEHIRRGDCYEINFCQEFFATEVVVDPVDVFENLTGISPNPFSALYKLGDKFLICASPERFLMKKGKKIFSQPMKGTSRRELADPKADALLKENLRKSAKERSENVMVVDMVRNDLSKICVDASVKVEELFGIYSYPQVHQMISTISGELLPEIKFSGIIGACFPMGSMTGAPKHKVMHLIDEYENSSRGIFSGSLGYIDPSGDFDFNVVIRSIMYNSSNRYLSYQTGSGITIYSEPELEWEECLLKGAAIREVLERRDVG